MKNLFLLFLFIGFIGFGQSLNLDDFSKSFNTVRKFDSRNKALVGSSYINDQFTAAKTSIDDNVYLIRYNTYQEEMEIERDGQPYHLPKSSSYTISFLNTNTIYRVYSFNTSNKIIKGYFIELVDGEKINFLLKESIRLIPEQKPKTGYDKYQPPTLKRNKDKYFIGYKNFTTIELPKKKHDFFNLFSTNSKIMEKFVKSNKLNIKNKEDLIKIFEYYNSL